MLRILSQNQVRLRLGKKKDRHAIDRFSWQEFQDVVQTRRWNEFEKDIKDDRREAELALEIEQIQELLAE
jgi:hypothetical protein